MPEINLKQLSITTPIKNAVTEYNDDITWSNYTISKEENQGFRLPRMERMMEADIDRLLDDEPIDVKAMKGKGIKIDGKLVQLYEIINGRHRVARAIIDGKPTISVNIMPAGGRRKSRRVRKPLRRKRTTKRRFTRSH